MDNYNYVDITDIRGELVLPINEVDNLNILLNENFKSSRNIVAGQLNKKVFDPIICSKIKFLAHEIFNPRFKQNKQFTILENNFIKCVRYTFIKGEDLNYTTLNNLYLNWKKELEYNIDGLVITNSDNIFSLELYKNPPYSIAFKLNIEEKETTVLDIEWKLTKHKKYIPIVIIDEIEIGGSKINKVTAYNAKYIVDNKIGKGAIIKITKAGEVIPKILSVIKTSPVNIELPSLTWKGVDVILDENVYNIDIVVIEILDFIKKFPFKNKDVIKGIGRTVIKKICLALKIKDIIELLQYEDVGLNELKLGPKTDCKLIKLIKEIKKQEITILDLLYSLNIFNNIGNSRLNLVFSNYNNLINDIRNNNIILENLTSIPGISLKIATELKRGFEYFNSKLLVYENYFNLKELRTYK